MKAVWSVCVCMGGGIKGGWGGGSIETHRVCERLVSDFCSSSSTSHRMYRDCLIKVFLNS